MAGPMTGENPEWIAPLRVFRLAVLNGMPSGNTKHANTYQSRRVSPRKGSGKPPNQQSQGVKNA